MLKYPRFLCPLDREKGEEDRWLSPPGVKIPRQFLQIIVRRSGGTRRTRVSRRSATENGGYARNVRRSPFQGIPSSLAFPSSRRFLRLLSTLEEDVTTILGEVASDSARSARRNEELEISSKKPPDTILLSHLSLLSLPRDLFFPLAHVAARWLPSLSASAVDSTSMHSGLRNCHVSSWVRSD